MREILVQAGWNLARLWIITFTVLSVWLGTGVYTNLHPVEPHYGYAPGGAGIPSWNPAGNVSQSPSVR